MWAGWLYGTMLCNMLLVGIYTLVDEVSCVGICAGWCVWVIHLFGPVVCVFSAAVRFFWAVMGRLCGVTCCLFGSLSVCVQGWWSFICSCLLLVVVFSDSGGSWELKCYF